MRVLTWPKGTTTGGNVEPAYDLDLAALATDIFEDLVRHRPTSHRPSSIKLLCFGDGWCGDTIRHVSAGAWLADSSCFTAEVRIDAFGNKHPMATHTDAGTATYVEPLWKVTKCHKIDDGIGLGGYEPFGE